MCKKFEIQNITAVILDDNVDDAIANQEEEDDDERTDDVYQRSSHDFVAVVPKSCLSKDLEEENVYDNLDDDYDDYFVDLKDNDDGDGDDLMCHHDQKNQSRLVELPASLLDFPMSQQVKRKTPRRKRKGSSSGRRWLEEEPQHPKDYGNYCRRTELLLDDQSGLMIAMAKLLPLQVDVTSSLSSS